MNTFNLVSVETHSQYCEPSKVTVAISENLAAFMLRCKKGGENVYLAAYAPITEEEFKSLRPFNGGVALSENDSPRFFPPIGKFRVFERMKNGGSCERVGEDHDSLKGAIRSVQNDPDPVMDPEWETVIYDHTGEIVETISASC